jgi:hypothetical protein
LGDDIERILEETLLDSESSLFDTDYDSSAIEDLRTHEASDSESESESAGNSTSPLQGRDMICLICGRTCLR